MPVVLVVTKPPGQLRALCVCSARWRATSISGWPTILLTVYAARRQTIVGSGHLNLNPELLPAARLVDVDSHTARRPVVDTGRHRTLVINSYASLRRS